MGETDSLICTSKDGKEVSIDISEIEFTAVRSVGPGGQHVNKTSSAVQLRLNIETSSLPPFLKDKLLKMNDHRITEGGDILIKVQEERSQLRNRETAINRLKELIEKALYTPKKRKKTRPTKSSIEKRLKTKKVRSEIKKLRGKID
jgi:ribosome-associated protein